MWHRILIEFSAECGGCDRKPERNVSFVFCMICIITMCWLMHVFIEWRSVFKMFMLLYSLEGSLISADVTELHSYVKYNVKNMKVFTKCLCYSTRWKVSVIPADVTEVHILLCNTMSNTTMLNTSGY